ncbi:hypothetical protein [Thiohalocapsa marina]|uniref:hypothetical protein n=1 Tax=Thiohalocapsa marina TaxID=424902 RepID=UPI0036DDF32F
MTTDELRRLAVLIERTDHDAIDRAAAYLRVCADALDAGPVAAAWMYHGKLVNAFPRSPRQSEPDIQYWLDKGYSEAPLYLLAMPAQAQSLRLPEPMTDEEIDAVTADARDELLDYIYEYGTSAEGVLSRVRRIARDAEHHHGITGDEA